MEKEEILQNDKRIIYILSKEELRYQTSLRNETTIYS